MAPPTLADVIFPEQANHNFSRILGDLKRSNLSVSNRLRSICRDAAFVDDVATALGHLPLVANERCGSWYIDPARKAASAYFKSTDGHTGQWKFSTRRLNLHLLALIGDAGGYVVR
jgi:tRNA A64-2'-O-ribosylphosphate transferase